MFIDKSLKFLLYIFISIVIYHVSAKNYKKLPILLDRQSIETTNEGLSKLFDNIDTDKNGKLTNKEIKEWVIKLFDKLARDDGLMHLHSLDKDKDGSLSWFEYRDHHYGETIDDMNPNSDNPDNVEIYRIYKMDHTRFNHSDKNKDGKLDIEELKRFLHPTNYADMADFEAYRTLQEYDTDKSGNIDKIEYAMIHYGNPNPKGKQLRQMKDFFDKYDKNHNGVIEEDEVSAWTTPDITQFSQHEADHLIHVSDTNKDSTLSRDEVINHMGHWLDSKATEYGEVIKEENRDEL